MIETVPGVCTLCVYMKVYVNMKSTRFTEIQSKFIHYLFSPGSPTIKKKAYLLFHFLGLVLYKYQFCIGYAGNM